MVGLYLSVWVAAAIHTAKHLTHKMILGKNVLIYKIGNVIIIIKYLSLINLIASSTFSTGTIGRIGPNISTCITLSLLVALPTIVGSIYLSDGSYLPPQTILSLLASTSAWRRLKYKFVFSKYECYNRKKYAIV